MSIHDIRRENLRKLIHQHGGPTRLATALGYRNGSFLSQVAGPRPIKQISEKVAREVEAKLGLPEGYLDRGDPAAAAGALDEGMLVDATREVYNAARLMDLDPDKVAHIVSLVYIAARTTGKVDPHFVQQLLQLAK